jgi:PAS domain S-box-containing protein
MDILPPPGIPYKMQPNDELNWLQMQSILSATNELIQYHDLDTVCRRTVELARQRLGVERCSLFVLDADTQIIHGTYGTDMNGQTTNEYHLRWVYDEKQHLSSIDSNYWHIVYDEEPQTQDTQPKRAWVAYTWMRQSEDTVILFCNDSAISRAPVDEARQQAIAVYISIVYGIIRRVQSEQALRTSETLFHAIFDSINEAVFLHDKDNGAILTVNQKACEMYGYTPEEMTRLRVGDLSEGKPPYTQQDAMQQIQMAGRYGPQLFDWHARDHAGNLFWVETSLRLAKIGQQERVIVTARNIDERKRMEQIRNAMYQIAATSVAAQNLEAFYPEIHRIIGELMPTKNFYIAIYDAANDLIHVPYYVDEYDPPPPPHHPQHGLTAHVLRTGKPLLLKYEDHYQVKDEKNIESIGTPAIDWLGVPLITNQGIIGVMTVQTYDERQRLTSTDREVLVFVSNQVAMTIQRRRAEEHQQQLTRSLQAVIEAADELLLADNLDTLYRRAVELGREKIGLERCGLYLLDATQEYLRGTYGTDTQGHTSDEHAGRLPTCDTPEIFSPSEQLYTILADSDLRQQSYWQQGEQIKIGNGWITATVIRNAVQPIGVFYNDTAITRAPFNPALQEATAVYCSLLGSIIDRKQLEEFEQRSIQRLNGVVQAADELITYTDSDTFYRRAVELAREKIGVERSAIFLLDPATQILHGTYGTDLQGNTTDEHGAAWAASALPQVFHMHHVQWTIIEQEYGYWQQDQFISNPQSGWVAHTLIRVANQPIGIFINDTALSQAPTDGMLQETIHLYCSLLGSMIQRLQSESERKGLINELSAKNAELERFTYTVSHDLKAPLITIRGFLGFLEKDARSGNFERLEQDMQRIIQATHKMQNLLDDLLELSRIGRIVGPPQTTPFGAIVEEALELVRGAIEQHDVMVAVSPDLPVIRGDRARLVEVIQNLVENAIKFMGDQPSPRIEIGAKQGSDTDESIFTVRDNGMGIEAKYHERIFGLFNKLDAQSEGTGIGLALVRRIIEVHGGHIWVESGGAGQGSTFCFTLPMPT